MKKKILGLALALIMVISLLPLTTLAADTPMPKYIINDDNLASRLERGIIPGEVTYIVFEDVLDTDGTTVLGNKPAVAAETPADNYIKMEFVDGVCQILFKNAKYKRTTGSSEFLQIVNNSGGYTNAFNIVLTLEGESTIEGLNTKMSFSNTGNMTVTGSGSLNINNKLTSAVLFQKKGEGDLIIKDTTFNISVYNDNEKVGTTGTICAAGNIVVDNSTLSITGVKNYGITVGTAYSTKLDDTTKGVTFKNGSNVTVQAGSVVPVYTNGPIKVENSNVEIFKGTGNTACFASSIPFATGVSVEMKKASGKTPYNYKEFSAFELEEGIAINKDDHKLIAYKAVHTCTAQADDGDCSTAVTCACGKEAVAAKQHAGVVTDCTKDAMCTNAGCTKVYAAKLGDAHTPAADDGDCTTDIKCANCDQVATKGAEKHVWDRTNCDVAGTCTNPGCTKTIEAGTHSGGTATCKDKAKCAECGKEYGELGACAPAADDGDCTTDIKCSVCGKTTTAGAAAHKYTDKNDTTCDNAGCTNTRKVEGTENPKTGDNSAIAVVAALMVTAAAAFVTTKKFAR